jgi:UDP:flavonoid glycosyltransferase YjiC (YdhE family)
MRILFLLFSPPTGTWGSLTRISAVADRARSEGHEVAFCASGYLEERLAKSGGQVFPMPRATMFGLPRPLSRLIERRSQSASLPVKEGRSVGSVWFVLRLSGMTGHSYLSRLVDAELDAIRRYRPDVLFTEMDPGAFLASRISGLPLFSTYASVMERGRGTRTYRRLIATMRKLLEEHGVVEELAGGPFHLETVSRVVPSLPELEDADALTGSCLFAGSLLASFGSASEGGIELDPSKRLVFVYVGTGSVPLPRLMEVLPKLFPAGSGTICLVGAQSVAGEIRLGNVVFRPYFDAGAIIPKCDWVICHGGHNTIMQSLASGVPLVIFPGAIFERRFNASMVQKAGAGLFLELSSFSEERLGEALKRRDACLGPARELGEKIRGYDGPSLVLAAMAAKVSRP